MVNAVSAVSGSQSALLRTDVQGSTLPAPTPQPALSSANFVVSGIYVDNLQNVAILEYRSSQTGEVIQQYPNQAQINAFKAAQRLAEQASSKQAEEAAQHAAAETAATTPHAATPNTVAISPVSSGDASSPGATDGSSTGGKTSVVA